MENVGKMVRYVCHCKLKRPRAVFLNVFAVSLDVSVEFGDRIPSPRWTLALITLIDHQLVPLWYISSLMSFRKIAIVVGFSHARQYLTQN